MEIDPKNLVQKAMKDIPFVKYAGGVAAAAILVAVARTALPDVTLAAMFPVLIGMFLLMATLKLVSDAVQSSSISDWFGKVIVGSIAITVVFFLTITASAIMVGMPSRWAKIILSEPAVEHSMIDKIDEGTVKPKTDKSLKSKTPQETHIPEAIKKQTVESSQPIATQVPSKIDPFYGVNLILYAKSLDSNRIGASLARNGIPFQKQAAQLTNPNLRTNAIGCSSDVPPRSILEVIQSLREADVSIQFILPFNSKKKKNRIEIFTYVLLDQKGDQIMPENPILSDIQLNSITSCPETGLYNE
jgi:hypothetical protein